jgi:transcriptional regulator with XRE-family HTH domain
MAGMADREDGSFDALLRRRREAARLTQAEVAERSGLTSQAISMLERGVRREPRVRTVELLADALGLDAREREALHAAARPRRTPDGSAAGDRTEEQRGAAAGRRSAAWRWGRRGAAVAAVALAGLIAATSPGWLAARNVTADPVGDLIGARARDWTSANRLVGPLQTERLYHDALPASFPGSREARLPAGVVPIVSYWKPTSGVTRYVASVNRPIILIFRYNPEPRMSGPAFVSAFEEQSRLIRSAHNADVRVATSAMVYQYQSSLNSRAATCGYIPPASSVDYYLSAVYDPYLEGIDQTDQGGFVVWQNCTRGLHRPRGIVELGLGLGTHGSAWCQPESRRTSVMYGDLAYLHASLPDLAVLEYWWNASPGAPCAQSWQFPADSSTADLWRTVANRAFGL